MRIINTHREPVPPEKILSEAEIIALCCKKVAVDDCSEVGRVGVYEGADDKHRNFDEKEALARARADYPNARILGVHVEGLGPPPGTPCGKLYESWQDRLNCCEGVTALTWDMNVTPEILPHDNSIIIAWDGSDGREVEVITTSNATWFSDGRKTAVGHGDSIQLFAGPTFCGATSVSVFDGCTTATVVLRSDLGQWLDRGPVCGGLAGVPTYAGGYYTLISGKYKQIETLSPRDWFVDHLYCADNAGITATCFEPPCPEAYCAAIGAAQPAGANPDTCLNIDILEYTASWRYGHHCILPGGAIAAPSSFWSTSVNCPNASGSSSLQGGFYAVTDTIRLYEWSC